MHRPALTLFAAATAILLAADDSFAQGGRSSGGGLGGGSGFGSSSFSSSFGSSSFGQSSFGGSGGGGSGFGSSFGQSAFGNSQSGFGSTGSGQNGNQNFVGRSAADLGAFFGAGNQTNQSTQRSQRSGNNRSRSSSSSTTSPEVRTAISASPELLRVATMNRASAAVTVSNVSRAMARKGMSGVTMSTQEGVAILEGVVNID